MWRARAIPHRCDYLVKTVYMSESFVEGLLSYAQGVHPREIILILRGKVDRDDIVVDETVIPPFATHGRGFSTFQSRLLPIDFSIVGVVHSHPSGNLSPSIHDLNHFYGRIMVILAYPYSSELHITAFNRKGEELKIEVIDRKKT